MFDRGRLTRLGTGSGILTLWLFLALAFAGYSPHDPPSSALWSLEGRVVSNPCGPVGAIVAFVLISTVGWGSLVALWGLGVGLALLFRGTAIPEFKTRIMGTGILVVVASALLAAGDEYRGHAVVGRSPAVGSGGYVGAMAATVLIGQLGWVGMCLVLGAMAVVGWAGSQEMLFGLPARETLEWMRRLRSPRGTRTYTAYTGAPMELLDARGAGVMPSLLPPPVRKPLPRAGMSEASARLGAGFPRVQDGSVPRVPDNGEYMLPPLELLDEPPEIPVQEQESLVQQRAMILEKTLREHGCIVRVVQIDTGPVITMFEIELEAGLRVSRVAGLSNDLAIALAVPSVRIVSPIPGKTTVGIEVPNERRTFVRLRDVIEGVQGKADRLRIPLFLGKDVKGQPLVFDLADMPHLLIAGATGTGKSVCLNAMILSMLMTRGPEEVKLILFDPKMVELSQFKRVPHLMHPVVTDMKKAEALLAWACEKMDERYALLARAGVRNIHAYNKLGPEEIRARLQLDEAEDEEEEEEERSRIPTYMPYIVIVADEMSDLMETAGKEVETHIVRLSQKARAAGIHLILATQKPTVEVLTGLIKGNMPARIAFQVTSRNDSRVVLDQMGAEKLLGNGDMIFLVPGTSHLVRSQGTYVADHEIERLNEFLSQYPLEYSKDLMHTQMGPLTGKDRNALRARDEMYEAAIDVIVREGRGSCSLLQRALGIGYGRAARLIDYMAEDGIVGEYKSGTFREVNFTVEEWEEIKNGGKAA